MERAERRRGNETPVVGEIKWSSNGIPNWAEGSDGQFMPNLKRLSNRSNVNERQEALVDFLDQLCTKEEVTVASDSFAARRYTNFFRIMYLSGDGFRHSYSEICRLVYDKVAPYESEKKLLSSVPPELSNLRHNLDDVIAALNAQRTGLLRKMRREVIILNHTDSEDEPYESRSRDEIRDEIERYKGDIDELGEIIKRVSKLYDHVSMEIERLSYMVRQNKCNSDAILKASRTVDSAVAEKEKQLKDLSEEIERTKKDVQRDNIAVLGIFAAVVLVVNSAVGFSSSSLEAIGAGHGVVPILLMAAIVGLVVINSSGIMLSFIWKMTIGDRPQLNGWPKWAWISVDVALCILIVYFLKIA